MAGQNNRGKNGNGSKKNNGFNQKDIEKKLASFGKLTPQQIIVIAGLLTNALSVDSVLIDKDQEIEIVLVGSLRRKTKLDRLVDEVSQMNVGDLIESLIRR
ncbi:hypothetical protein ACFQ88_10610 [Paenibacillus sp. NPDC056579]|uniref:hypothetical protein n=1 Tax=unclassified Paenibacillus TaxID=185978 RepID=UPI001EF7B7D0|nr:hypothetical protein [Paenibacillus sp. H1-7]